MKLLSQQIGKLENLNSSTILYNSTGEVIDSNRTGDADNTDAFIAIEDGSIFIRTK